LAVQLLDRRLAGHPNLHMIDPSLVDGGGCDDNLVCGICTLVLKRPSSGCPQGHTFCEACLVRTLEGSGNASREVAPRPSCPTCRHPTDTTKLVRNRPIENMVLALKVACVHSEAKGKPCAWSGLLGSLDTHLGSDCPNQPVPCPNPGCLVHMPRRDMGAHASDACTRRPVPCRHCGLACPKDEVGAHEASCELAPVTCRHGCGATGLLQKQAAAHEQTCPLAPTPCPCLGCGAIVKRKDMSEHLASYAVEHARAVAVGVREMREHAAAQQQTIDRLEGVVREQEGELSDLKTQLAAVQGRVQLDEAASSQRSTRSLSASLASLPLSREALRGAAADVGATAFRVKERIALLPADVSRRASRARSAASGLHAAAHATPTPTPTPTPTSPGGGGGGSGGGAAAATDAAADGAAASGGSSSNNTSAPSSRRPSRERRLSPASATSSEQMHRRRSLQSMSRSLSRRGSRGTSTAAPAAADGAAPSPARVAAASATAAAIAAAAAAAANPPTAASPAAATGTASAATAWQPPPAAREPSSPRLVVAAGNRSSLPPAGMPPGAEADSVGVGRVNVVIESEV